MILAERDSCGLKDAEEAGALDRKYGILPDWTLYDEGEKPYALSERGVDVQSDKLEGVYFVAREMSRFFKMLDQGFAANSFRDPIDKITKGWVDEARAAGFNVEVQVDESSKAELEGSIKNMLNEHDKKLAKRRGSLGETATV